MSPLASRELDELADYIVRETLNIRLHTGAPGNAGTDNRVSAGGGSFENGVDVAAAGWSNASSGDVSNVAAIDYGTASGGNPGTLTHWSAFRGNDYVASGTLDNTTINDGDSFQINAGEIEFLGSTT